MTWAEANHIARLAMGTVRERKGRGRIAGLDPLACWCLTELVHVAALSKAGV